MIIFNTKKLYGGRLGKKIIQGGVTTDHPAYGKFDGVFFDDLSDPNITNDMVIKDPSSEDDWYLKSTIKDHVEGGPGLQAGWPLKKWNPMSREDAISAGVENPQYENISYVSHLDDTIPDAMMVETQADTYRLRGPEIDQEIRDYVYSRSLDHPEQIIRLAIHRAQRNGERWRDYVDRVKEQQESSRIPYIGDEEEEEEDDEGFDVSRTPDLDEEENTQLRRRQLETDMHNFLTERGILPYGRTRLIYHGAFMDVFDRRSTLEEQEDNYRGDIRNYLSIRLFPTEPISRRRPREDDDDEGVSRSRPRLSRGGKLKIKKPKHLKSIVHTIAHDVAKPIGEDLGKAYPVNPFSLGYDLGYKVIGPAILKSTGGGHCGKKFKG